jgi:hypothetical protein
MAVAHVDSHVVVVLSLDAVDVERYTSLESERLQKVGDHLGGHYV